MLGYCVWMALFAPPMFVSSRERNVFEATILLKGIDEETSTYLAKILTNNIDEKTTKSTTNKTTKGTTNKVSTKATQRVLAEIIKNSEISIDEIADICGLSYYGVYYHLRKLRKSKIIIRVGGTADGYWKVLSIK